MHQSRMLQPAVTRKLKGYFITLILCYSFVGGYIWWRTARVYEMNPYLEGYDRAQGYVKDTSFTPVVIVGYMRSGSSLTGDIIQQQPQVFYVFEPLHDLQQQYITKKESQFPNYRFKGDRPSMILKEEAVQVLRAWLTCDVNYVQAEKQRFHLSFFKYGLKTNKLIQCLNQSSISNLRNTKSCTIMLRRQCLKSKFRVLKTIRTSIQWLSELMEEYQSMKIIHLVRDPRAIINSQIKFGACDSKHGGVIGCSQYLCSTMEDDLNAYDYFKRLFPDRLLRVRFEDLAQTPIEVTKQLYKFVGAQITPDVESYVFNATMAGNKPDSIMSTIRSNSSDVIDQWRTSLSDSNLGTVQVMCEYAMKKLSYYHFIRPD